MENQNLAGILKHREKNLWLKDLENQLPPLNEVEKKIIKSRLTGLSFCQLSETALRIATDKIIINGAAIFGCGLPQTELLAEAISDQLIDFILDFGYEELTLDEILLSLLINSKGVKFPSGAELEQVKFSGVCIGVDFIASILSNYMYLRNMLDKKIKNKIDGY